MKKCNRCGVIKSLSDFYIRDTGKSNCVCKKCKEEKIKIEEYFVPVTAASRGKSPNTTATEENLPNHCEKHGRIFYK